MASLEFNQELISQIAENRSDQITGIFQFFSFMGEIEGYIILIALVCVAFDKRLGFSAAVVVIVSMIVNHILKIILQNPRPFVAEGTHFENWAVSSENAMELAAEFSTPSGHAMAAAAFYGFLFLRVTSLPLRVMLVFAILIVGISRPMIGVHFAEDIVLGWVAGFGIAVFMHRYIDQFLEKWSTFPTAVRIAALVLLSAAVWLLTTQLLQRPLGDQPTAFVGYLGFLTGVLLAIPIEQKHIGFDAAGAPVWMKSTRFLIMLAIIVGGMIGLEIVFEWISHEETYAGFGLRYFRYALSGILGIAVAPWIFQKLGIGTRPINKAP